MQQVRRITRTAQACAAATIAVVATFQPVFAEAPAALSQAPKDAQFVFIVPSMAEFSGKLAMLNQTLGLNTPELSDALGAFKAEVGVGDGLNDAGSAMLVIQDLATAIQTEQEPDILMVLPVTDYPTFISSFQAEGAAPAGDGVTEVTMPDGQAGYAVESGGYAIMGNTESAVSNFAPGGDAGAIAQRIGEHGRGYLDGCDAAIYLDLAAMAPALTPKIDQMLEEVQEEFDGMAGMGMADPSGVETMRAALSLYAQAGKAILNSADGMVVTLDISEHGIGLTDSVQFKPDSAVMKYLPGSDAGTSSILSRLPRGSYIVAGAFDTEALAVTELFTEALDAMPADNPQLATYRKAMPLVEQMQQYAAVLYTPDPAAMMGGAGGLNVLAAYKVKDGESYVQQAKSYIQEMNGQSIPLGLPASEGQEAPAMTYTTSYTDNALQLDGVQVDQYSMQVQMPPEMMMQMGPAAGFMQMFTNFNGYIAESDGYYLTTTTLDQQLVAKGLATGKAGDGMGSAGSLADVRAKAVPAGAVGEFYLSFAGIVEFASPMASMIMGLPPIEAPQDLPPVAVGLGLQDNSSAARLYVPNDTIKFVVDTVKDVQAHMMGGPGGPGQQQPGQGAPPPPF